MSELLTEVGRFREWANSYPPERRSGEWECDYDQWGDLHDAVLKFVAARPFATWSGGEVRAVLYAVARDNEIQYLAREIRLQHPATLVALAEAALAKGECDDRWQLAVELGYLGQAGGDAEQVLLLLARDENEYVRRRALGALTHLGSPAVEQLALEAWHRPHEHQEWARMMALGCLYRVGSPHLEPLLAEAERDERPHLSGYARRVRQGQVD